MLLGSKPKKLIMILLLWAYTSDFQTGFPGTLGLRQRSLGVLSAVVEVLRLLYYYCYLLKMQEAIINSNDSTVQGHRQKLKCHDRQYCLTLLCSYVNRGSRSHWNTSLGFRSCKKFENCWPRLLANLFHMLVHNITRAEQDNKFGIWYLHYKAWNRKSSYKKVFLWKF